MNERSRTKRRCVSCGRLVAAEQIGARVEGFPSLCFCRRCDREQQQSELELVEARRG